MSQPGEGGAVHRRIVDAEVALADAHVGVHLVSGDGGELRVGAEELEEEYWDSGEYCASDAEGKAASAATATAARRERAVMDPPGAASRGALRESTDRGFRSWRVVHGPAGRGPESVAEERVVHRE